jgi:hypothetical protein
MTCIAGTAVDLVFFYNWNDALYQISLSRHDNAETYYALFLIKAFYKKGDIVVLLPLLSKY